MKCSVGVKEKTLAGCVCKIHEYFWYLFWEFDSYGQRFAFFFNNSTIVKTVSFLPWKLLCCLESGVEKNFHVELKCHVVMPGFLLDILPE